MVCIYCQFCVAPQVAWLLSGIAVRFALDIGLHREKASPGLLLPLPAIPHIPNTRLNFVYGRYTEVTSLWKISFGSARSGSHNLITIVHSS